MFTPRMRHFPRAIAMLATGVLLSAATMSSVALADEITVSITSVKGLDKVMKLFRAAIISPESRSTVKLSLRRSRRTRERSSRKGIKKSVSSGEHKVKLELIDKDLTEDDPVDVNRLANKRDLEFTVDTKSCEIEGFSSSPRCGSTIVRAGKENKKAEISFKITVKKN